MSIPADVPGSSSRFGPPVSGSDPLHLFPAVFGAQALTRTGARVPGRGDAGLWADRAPSALVSGWTASDRGCPSPCPRPPWSPGHRDARPRFSTVEIALRPEPLSELVGWLAAGHARSCASQHADEHDGNAARFPNPTCRATRRSTLVIGAGRSGFWLSKVVRGDRFRGKSDSSDSFTVGPKTRHVPKKRRRPAAPPSAAALTALAQPPSRLHAARVLIAPSVIAASLRLPRSPFRLPVLVVFGGFVRRRRRHGGRRRARARPRARARTSAFSAASLVAGWRHAGQPRSP